MCKNEEKFAKIQWYWSPDSEKWELINSSDLIESEYQNFLSRKGKEYSSQHFFAKDISNNDISATIYFDKLTTRSHFSAISILDDSDYAIIYEVKRITQ